MIRLPVIEPSATVAAGPLGEPRAIDCKTRPVYVVWEITLACNLECVHCGSRAGRAREVELDTAQCLDLVDQLDDIGCREVILIGGEVYLRRDHLEIIERIAERGMEPLMTTGGRGLTAARAAAMGAAGLLSASVSIDGIGATHDQQRGWVGSYDAALAAMDNLLAGGVNVSVNTQINKLSLPQLEAILEVAIERGAHSWQVQITVPMGRAADRPDLILQPEDLLVLFPTLERIIRRCHEADVRLWPGNNIGYFGPYESMLHGTMAAGHCGSCGAGCVGFGIESDGTVKGCPSLATRNWAAGNVREHRLVDIWERAPRLQHNRTRTVDDLWGYCRDCYYAEHCLAGCTWTSESLLGRPGNNPLCHHRVLEMAAAGKRERLVPVNAAPGEPFDMGRFDLVVEPL